MSQIYRTDPARFPFGGGRLDRAFTVTAVIIGANVLVWLAIVLTGGNSSAVLRAFQLSPAGTCLVSANLNQYLPGVDHAQCVAIAGMTWSPGVASGAWWQVLTSAFAHVQIWHIGFNMLALVFLGPAVEKAIGRARYVALYMTAALTGSAAVMWFSSPNVGTLGASGAVFGLMGALLVLAWAQHGDVRPVLMWLAINVAYTFLAGGVSWQAHLGGLAGGLIVGGIIVGAPRLRRARSAWPDSLRLAWRAAAGLTWAGIIALVIVVMGLIVIRAMALR